MLLPDHVTPAIASRRGQAPYNFVPLPEAIFLPPGEPFRAHDRLDPGRLHGCIDLDIITETELYTRCAYPPAEENRDVQRSRPRQAFYHHGDENRPVIPGSSLRGMIRSLVEILSYSRITRRPAKGEAVRIQDEKLVHRAVADQETPTGQAYNERFLERLKPMQFYYPSRQVQAGYLEKNPATGGWRIRPACKVQGSSFIRVHLSTLTKNGFPDNQNHVQDVWVKPESVQPHRHRNGLVLYYALTGKISNAAQSGMVRGVLVYSGPMQTRHMHIVIYERDMKTDPIPIPAKMWEQFCEDRDQQRGIPCRKIRDHGDPLFYLLNNKGQLEFFGPTLFFRLPYLSYTGDYIPQDIVANDSPLDLAEATFGTVNGEPQENKPHTGSHRGRILVADAELIATPDNGSPFLEEQDGIRWPSVLSTPKPTSYQNYLVQSHPEGKREKLLSYSAPPPDAKGKDETTVLRGFKQYWHRGSASKELHLQPPTKHYKQYTVILPVRPGVRFRGQVRFENLTPLELGALLAALELPENYRHHLGMGKPLGMGSVQIRATVTLIDPIQRYRSLVENGRLDEMTQADKLVEVREAFRNAIIDHHNKTAPTSLQVTSTARLWDIPRLQTLGYLLDWENRRYREKTSYFPNPKAFRSRQVLPTPAGVLGRPEPISIVPADQPSAGAVSSKFEDIIAAIPTLQTLQTILQDSVRSQRERLEAIDETLLRELAELDEALRQRAWEMIRWAIGVNRKTRNRLQEIQQRLGRETL